MSQSREDYVKYIYEFGQGDRVANKDIAQGLSVSPASVTEMLKKLAEEELVDLRPYQGVRLTDKGNDLATSLIRKHEVWEYFLVNALGYEKSEVHDIAEILEHSTPDDMAERLAEFIDYRADWTAHD
ncbi:metal-dependent transcriptional regulator [Suicoccus acidiformans]|nr:metal-dependent transcriptional regulator [Suicoccus acidiformans]